MNAEYEDICKLAQEFSAKLRDYHGVNAVLVMWNGIDEGSGGYHREGNHLISYAQAKKYTLNQEGQWLNREISEKLDGPAI